MKNRFHKNISLVALASLLAIATANAEAQEKPQLDRINNAEFSPIGSLIREDSEARDIDKEPSPFVIRAQIALDRAGFSVGVIDGYDGENVGKAVKAFQQNSNIEPTGELNEKTWQALETNAETAMQEYTLTEDDIAGPYLETIPDDYADLAELEEISYTSVEEMIAERFHMDEDLLEYLNPDVDFSKAGSSILVADAGADVSDRKVTYIRVDGSTGTLEAFDADNRLVVVYPATVGSDENPSPSGTHKVRAIAPNPTYSYRPDVNFVQGENKEPLTLPPGPNGPVGSMWIDLTEPTYGIHGTPAPSKISKTQSHGCVRLTNWDAHELSKLVSPGTVVEFAEGSGAAVEAKR